MILLFSGMFWDGNYVGQIPYVWYYVGVKNMLVRNASPIVHTTILWCVY